MSDLPLITLTPEQRFELDELVDGPQGIHDQIALGRDWVNVTLEHAYAIRAALNEIEQQAQRAAQAEADLAALRAERDKFKSEMFRLNDILNDPKQAFEWVIGTGALTARQIHALDAVLVPSEALAPPQGENEK